MNLPAPESIPWAADGMRVETFPFNRPNVFTLEHTNDGQHFAYKFLGHGPDVAAAYRAEDEACEQVIAEHVETLRRGVIIPPSRES